MLCILISGTTKSRIAHRTHVCGPVAPHYLTHSPIGLEHATIKDNIIFGSAYGYDESRYNQVIEACALVRDLEIFDAGDLTG